MRGSPRAVRRHGHRGHPVQEDGAGDHQALRADDGAALGRLDGLVLELGRHVRRLLGAPGRGHDPARRRLRPGLPAAPRVAAPGADAAAAEDQARRAPDPRRAAEARAALPARRADPRIEGVTTTSDPRGPGLEGTRPARHDPAAQRDDAGRRTSRPGRRRRRARRTRPGSKASRTACATSSAASRATTSRPTS